MNTKQVIVIRKDLNMRKGKMCAQASHASMAFITTEMCVSKSYGLVNEYYIKGIERMRYCEEIEHWLENSFRKICVYVNSEQELEEIHQKALDNRLISHIITDNGVTEFNGVPTKTCCAIGPHKDSKFEGITNHLPLL
jgi:PTH2 family peptidyl-tRNA hydrolase